MTPQLRNAITSVVEAYHKTAKESYDGYAFNRKPADHVFKSIQILKDAVRVNRRIPKYTLTCTGPEEIHFLINVALDIIDSLALPSEQILWTTELFDKALIYCLNVHPRTREQKTMKECMDRNPGLKIEMDECKRMILARIRNMLLTQNI